MALLNLPPLQQDLQQFIDQVDHIYQAIDIDVVPASRYQRQEVLQHDIFPVWLQGLLHSLLIYLIKITY